MVHGVRAGVLRYAFSSVLRRVEPWRPQRYPSLMSGSDDKPVAPGEGDSPVYAQRREDADADAEIQALMDEVLRRRPELKERAREEDARALAAGRVSAEELHDRNSHLGRLFQRGLVRVCWERVRSLS